MAKGGVSAGDGSTLESQLVTGTPWKCRAFKDHRARAKRSS